jgi:hypothetical protein
LVIGYLLINPFGIGHFASSLPPPLGDGDRFPGSDTITDQ